MFSIFRVVKSVIRKQLMKLISTMRHQLCVTALLLVLAPYYALTFSWSTNLCDAVLSGQKTIQGVVIFQDNSNGLLFVDDHVFPFNPSIQLSSSHSLHISSSGEHVEKHFANLYLNGNNIFNVYGLFTNTSQMIYFVVTNQQLSMENLDKEIDISKGFIYKMDERRSYEMEGAIVPPKFPFVYFSDNEANIYMYQIPVYTFRGNAASTGYFGYNTFDKQMEFKKVSGLAGLNENQKEMALLGDKMLLRSAFIYNGHVYLITAKDVYVLTLEDMKTNAMPQHQKVALSQFLKCDPGATLSSVEWSSIIAYGLATILVILIFVLLYLICKPSPK